MATEKQDSSSLITALPITVVVVALAGLLFTKTLPYKDERPSNDHLKTVYSPFVQDVDARLWQDPFAAVEDISDPPPTTDKSPVKIQKNFYPINPSKYTVLAVTLPGGPYQETGEERMRRRYAVLSALSNQGAYPYDEKHIGYFNLDMKIGINFQKKLPFEWWIKAEENKESTNNYILLLWVDESSLSHSPAIQLREILIESTKLFKGNPNGFYGCDNSSDYDYMVIGPNSSTVLQKMVLEVDGIKIKKEKDGTNIEADKICDHEIMYFPAAATASDKNLLKNIRKKPPENLTISDFFYSNDVTLKRITANDYEMMKILVDELGARRIGENDHVVIISEWDTVYGRSMPESFKNINEEYNKKFNIHPYGYMRGLDGKLPEKRDKGDKSAKVNGKSGTSEMSVPDVQLETPEGKSQKDYLRRLTDSILEKDQRLKQGINRKGISAFGILGSDVHDKLMIMEALRQHFPHKVFFTSDLDAIYNHPNHISKTHNLLVVSAFDLKLR